MGADPFGSVPKLEWIGRNYTRDLIYLIQFRSAIRTRLDRINSRTSLDRIHSGPVGTHGSDSEYNIIILFTVGLFTYSNIITNLNQLVTKIQLLTQTIQIYNSGY